ncbi:MAG: hypothetical protein EOR84_01225 [Mesorhizobium sp.]|uniref:alcohol dehydrogenase catalytic domain-containing protein n=1 Tax=Mesorhizobium sp. TaxID=1871066 RepID=UPI000FE4D1C3|nr:alcohol dehydrogenase catalytic domain-containing protein [Mesorhizobium sp.]RWN03638.1 MAG: hypothetical protein EOR84_01225 [Mesorhizobium sp.]
MKAVVMNRTGGPDALEFVERPETAPTSGQVLVEVAAAGVNFMDIGVRQGMAWTETPNPKVLGVEGAGRVLAVGDGVEHFRPGQRVARVYEVAGSQPCAQALLTSTTAVQLRGDNVP